MADRIFFLGTGGTAACTAKQLRATGGFLISHDDIILHIDPGPGALTALHQYGINPRAITAILCSHNHLNHSHDINALATAISLNQLDTHSVLITSESTLMSGMVSEHHLDCFEKVIVAQPKKPIGLENIEIKPIPAAHEEPLALGFRITTPNFIIAYSGDTAYSEEVVENYKGADILILNIVNPYNKTGDQLSMNDAERILNEVKPKLAILTHFGQEILQANPLYEARELKKATGVNVIATEDGMSIDPVLYNATVTQKTLTMYPK